MYYTIYRIVNKINNKTYIGKHKTNNLDDGYFGSGKLLYRAIKKYGKENFTKRILFVFDNEQDMNNKEKELVVISENTYNLCPGGQGGFGYINENKLNNPKLGRQKADNILLIKYNITNPGQLQKTRNLNSDRFRLYHKLGLIKPPSWLGKKHKEETKKKISEANKKMIGEKNSQYGTCWITNGKENKKIRKEELDSYIQQGYYKGRI